MTYVEVVAGNAFWKGEAKIPGFEQVLIYDDDAYQDFDDNVLEKGDLVIRIKLKERYNEMGEGTTGQYDQLILDEIKELMNETRESYEYVEKPLEAYIERMKDDKAERRAHVKGKLQDLMMYLEQGKFW